MDASATPRDRADAKRRSEGGELRYQPRLPTKGRMLDNCTPPARPVLPLRHKDAFYPGNLGGRLGVHGQERPVGCRA
jgi:hypothetical protein